MSRKRFGRDLRHVPNKQVVQSVYTKQILNTPNSLELLWLAVASTRRWSSPFPPITSSLISVDDLSPDFRQIRKLGEASMSNTNATPAKTPSAEYVCVRPHNAEKVRKSCLGAKRTAGKKAKSSTCIERMSPSVLQAGCSYEPPVEVV
jgi:hypothetical protein